jgi:hypothetical protein
MGGLRQISLVPCWAPVGPELIILLGGSQWLIYRGAVAQ